MKTRPLTPFTAAIRRKHLDCTLRTMEGQSNGRHNNDVPAPKSPTSRADDPAHRIDAPPPLSTGHKRIDRRKIDTPLRSGRLLPWALVRPSDPVIWADGTRCLPFLRFILRRPLNREPTK